MRTLFLTIATAASALAYTPTPLEEGDSAPDFKLPGIDDKDYTLTDFSGKEALAIIFTTNHCPDAITSHDRMIALVDHFKDKSVNFVAINSNSPEGIRLDELRFSAYDDGFEDMKVIAKDKNFNLPYLFDGNTQEVAKAYGAVATPHVFIFDKDLKLRYNGRMDDGRRKIGPTEKNEARDAITSILAGEKVKVVKTRPVGCTTKWKEKSDAVATANAKWKAQKVTVEVAGAETLGKIAANKGNKGMRLINLWSTTCAPCLHEFPDLAEIYRIYSLQNFEFIPISLDPASDIEKVTQFLADQECGLPKHVARTLENEQRTTNNYIFDGDTEDLGKAIDPEWNGALPYTVLIGADGKVLFRHSGVIDPLKLKKIIVKQIWEDHAK